MPDQDTRGVVKQKKPRLSPIPETHRLAITEFLEHFRYLFELELNDARTLAMQYRTEAYVNETAYKRHKVATVEALIAYNEQRRRK